MIFGCSRCHYRSRSKGNLYDVGFAQSDTVGEGVVAEAVWCDPLMVAVPARQVQRVLRRSGREPLVVERVASFELLMVVVSAGFTSGLAGGLRITASREPGVVARPLAGRSPMLKTYLLGRDGEASQVLFRLIERVQASTVRRHKARPAT